MVGWAGWQAHSVAATPFLVWQVHDVISECLAGMNSGPQPLLPTLLRNGSTIARLRPAYVLGIPHDMSGIGSAKV